MTAGRDVWTVKCHRFKNFKFNKKLQVFNNFIKAVSFKDKIHKNYSNREDHALVNTV